MSGKSKTPNKTEKTFRELERELETVLGRVERAEYDDLDDLLADYETGKKLIDELEKKLVEAQNSINKVAKV